MFEENKKKILILIVVAFVILTGGSIYYFLQDTEDEYIDLEMLETNEEVIAKNEIVEEVNQIIVHISGEVVNPGVISLNENSRLIDAIKKVGGLTSTADISKINLAYILEDAQKIYIPNKNDNENVIYILEGSGDDQNSNNNREHRK